MEEPQFAVLSLDGWLHEAVFAGRGIKSHEAKRRQLQYIGRLMRSVDAAPIRARLAALEGSSAQATAQHRRPETWRGRLLADDEALTEFAAAFPATHPPAPRAPPRNARTATNE